MTFLLNPYRFATAAGGGGGTAARYWSILALGFHSGGNYGYGGVEMRETTGGPNVATLGSITASATTTNADPGSWGPNNAFDGDDATAHVTDGPGYPQRLAVDFGAGNTRAINRVTIIPRTASPENMPGVFAIERSDDGATWTTVWVGHGSTPTAGVAQHFDRPTFTAADSVRYAELLIRSTGSTVASFSELALKAGAGNILTGGTASASTTLSGFVPANVLDGSTGTIYHSTGMPTWWRYDNASGLVLPATLDITPRVDGFHDQAPGAFRVLRSLDAVNWMASDWLSHAWTGAAMQSFSLTWPS